MTAIPFEYNELGIGERTRVINRINADGGLDPSAAGHIQIDPDTGAFRWWDDVADVIRSVGPGGEYTLQHRPVQLSALDIVSTGDMPVFLRNAAGDYYWERTAAGAETVRISFQSPYKVETALKGAKLTKVVMAYELATADLTSLDLRFDSTVFAQGVNPAVTNSHGGAVVDGDYDSNHNTAAKRKDSTVVVGEHLLTLTLNTPAYYATSNGSVRVECAVVMANTGVFRLRYMAAVYSETPI